ncbi:MAG TPA: hypothetical protein VME01_04305 [Solirubrobacteraceae bacterium]|nr:hypothetical protein [Solirubrobacteraceae bacterium]
MTSKLSRSALIAALAVGASGLVAVPAASAANPNVLVKNPIVTGASSITPESAVVTGAVDTGGDPASTITASAAAPITLSGITLTANAQLDGIPVGALPSGESDYYSTVLFEADPVSDYTSNGDQPGPDTVLAGTVEVPTSTGLTAVKATIGGTQASSILSGSSPLTPGTKYVYWLQQQAGETDAATTVNAFSGSGLQSFVAGGDTAHNSNYAAWVLGDTDPNAATDGNTYAAAGDPGADPVGLSGSLTNPDWSCVIDAGVPGATETAAEQTAISTNATVPAAPLSAATLPADGDGIAANDNLNLQYGISAVSASGAITADTAAQPASQGPCVGFYSNTSTIGGTNTWYTSPVGYFTTPKLGKIDFARPTIVGTKAKFVVTDKSVVRASGEFQLKVGSKTIGTGKFNIAANTAGKVTVKLSKAGIVDAAKGKTAKIVLVTSNNDQPSGTKTVKL